MIFRNILEWIFILEPEVLGRMKENEGGSPAERPGKHKLSS